MWVGTTIFQLELNGRGAIFGRCQLTARNLLLQPQQLGGGLGDIHIQRIELLDGGQTGGLLCGDQGAFGDGGLTDTA